MGNNGKKSPMWSKLDETFILLYRVRTRNIKQNQRKSSPQPKVVNKIIDKRGCLFVYSKNVLLYL